MRRPLSARRKRTLIAIGIMLVFGIVALLWLRPRALALYHQVQGGSILSAVNQAIPNSNPNDYACFPDPVSDAALRARLARAVTHLQAAREYNPGLAQADLLLGRAYCLLGEPERAIQAYQQYVRLRPDNPLGHLELGFAYALDSQKAALAEWQKAGVTPAQVLSNAEQAFNQKNYRSAADWYRLNSVGDDNIQIPILLRWAIAASVSGLQLPDSASQILPVFPISATGTTRIQAGDFRWLRDIPGQLTYGDRLADHKSGNSAPGVMWWSGDAVIILRVPVSGKYAITINAQNTPPPPIQMTLSLDLKTVYAFEMDRGDMSWQEFQTEVDLSAGYHVIGLSYLNNGIVDGVARDAIIDGLEIDKK